MSRWLLVASVILLSTSIGCIKTDSDGSGGDDETDLRGIPEERPAPDRGRRTETDSFESDLPEPSLEDTRGESDTPEMPDLGPVPDVPTVDSRAVDRRPDDDTPRDAGSSGEHDADVSSEIGPLAVGTVFEERIQSHLILDPSGSISGPEVEIALEVDPAIPHVVYEADRTIFHMWRDGDVWQTRRIDGPQALAVLDFDFIGTNGLDIGILYTWQGSNCPGPPPFPEGCENTPSQVRLATVIDGRTEIVVVSETSQPSFPVGFRWDARGYYHTVFIDSSTAYAWRDASGVWNRQEVLSEVPSGLAFDLKYNNRQELVYEFWDEGLFHATYQSGWETTRIAEAGALRPAIYSYLSSTVVTYYDRNTDQVVYSRRELNDPSWESEVVESNISSTWTPSIVDDGRVHISYTVDSPNGHLHYATKDNPRFDTGPWQVYDLGIGRGSDLGLGRRAVHLVFYDDDGLHYVELQKSHWE